MKYITHHRFRQLALCGRNLNLPYGTELERIGDCLYTKDSEAVCVVTSENAKKHFARNDDRQGLKRGALTYAIAYSGRMGGNGFRFSDREIDILKRDWVHFLRNDVPVVLFNEDFFAADPLELQNLAEVLKIKIRR